MIRRGLYASVGFSELATLIAGINRTFESVTMHDVNSRRGLYASVDFTEGTAMFDRNTVANTEVIRFRHLASTEAAMCHTLDADNFDHDCIVN